jgi:large subunit ribosomal protein L22
MEARAIAKSVRMSARKVRLVVDLIRGKSVGEAYSILQFSPKSAAEPVSKTLRSAVANADEGATLHRHRRAAMGRAAPIRKRTSHITVVVDKRSN